MLVARPRDASKSSTPETDPDASNNTLSSSKLPWIAPMQAEVGAAGSVGGGRWSRAADSDQNRAPSPSRRPTSGALPKRSQRETTEAGYGRRVVPWLNALSQFAIAGIRSRISSSRCSARVRPVRCRVTMHGTRWSWASRTGVDQRPRSSSSTTASRATPATATSREPTFSQQRAPADVVTDHELWRWAISHGTQASISVGPSIRVISRSAAPIGVVTAGLPVRGRGARRRGSLPAPRSIPIARSG